MRQPVHCWFSARAIAVPREAAMRSKRASQSGSRAARTASRAAPSAASSAASSCWRAATRARTPSSFSGKLLHLGAGLGQLGFVRLRALQARVFLVLQPLGFGAFKLNLVLDGRGLLGVVTESFWARNLAAFWRCASISRSRRVRSVSSRLSAAEISAEWLSAAASRGLRLGDLRGQRLQTPG